MERVETNAIRILSVIGSVEDLGGDALVVTHLNGCQLQVSPSGSDGIPTDLIIEEVFTPEEQRRKGLASRALRDLCELADEYGFLLRGGPLFRELGAGDNWLYRWLTKFAFESTSDRFWMSIVERDAPYVIRVPCGVPRTRAKSRI